MGTYKVLKGTKLIEYVTYTVEADSEKDAIQMVKDDEVFDNGDHWTTDTGEETYNIQK